MSFSRGIFAGLIAGVIISIVYAIQFQLWSMAFEWFFPLFDTRTFIQGELFPLHFFVAIIWGMIFGLVYSKTNLAFHGDDSWLAIQFAAMFWGLTILPMLLFFWALIKIDAIVLLFWAKSFFIAFILGMIALVKLYKRLP